MECVGSTAKMAELWKGTEMNVLWKDHGITNKNKTCRIGWNYNYMMADFFVKGCWNYSPDDKPVNVRWNCSLHGGVVVGIGRILGKDVGATVPMESWKCTETTGDQTKLLWKGIGAKANMVELLWEFVESSAKMADFLGKRCWSYSHGVVKVH